MKSDSPVRWLHADLGSPTLSRLVFDYEIPVVIAGIYASPYDCNPSLDAWVNRNGPSGLPPWSLLGRVKPFRDRYDGFIRDSGSFCKKFPVGAENEARLWCETLVLDSYCMMLEMFEHAFEPERSRPCVVGASLPTLWKPTALPMEFPPKTVYRVLGVGNCGEVLLESPDYKTEDEAVEFATGLTGFPAAVVLPTNYTCEGSNRVCAAPPICIGDLKVLPYFHLEGKSRVLQFRSKEDSANAVLA